MQINGNTPISELYHADDELMHYGVKGMKWGVRRYLKEKHNQVKNAIDARKDRDRRARTDTRYARTGNKLQSEQGDVLTRQTSKYDDPHARKKRIDADIKEADDRVKFYGSKRAAKAAIADEANFAKAVNRGKAMTETIVYGGAGSVAGLALAALAELGAGGTLVVAGGPVAAVGVVSAVAATRANNFINKHARDQILYTEDSEYGHDIVVALKKH